MAFYIRSCWKINPGCGSASDGPGCRHRIRYRSCWRHSNTGLSRISVHSWCPPARPCRGNKEPRTGSIPPIVVGGNIHVGAGGLIVGGKGKRLPCGHFAGPGQQTHQVLGGFKGERGGVGLCGSPEAASCRSPGNRLRCWKHHRRSARQKCDSGSADFRCGGCRHRRRSGPEG